LNELSTHRGRQIKKSGKGRKFWKRRGGSPLLPPALGAGGDAQGGTVFGHRPPGHEEAFFGQKFPKGLVGKRVAGVLSFHSLADPVFYPLL
jgi:hypothetical protein